MTTPDTSIASRLLDINVAKLMGYTVCQITDKYWRLTDPQGRLVEMADDWYEDESRSEYFAWQDAPEFSSSRSAAFELAWSFYGWNIEFLVDSIHIETDEGAFHGRREDFALIVCRAALQAKGLSL